MIEREFINQKTKEFYIKRYIESKLGNVGLSSIKLKKIPLGEKIIIDTSRPSLIVGSKGSTIRELTRVLKKEFKLENPQIEINEVKNIFLDPSIVAERIASSLERFGSARFKGVGHKTLANVISAGALGVEIIISGKIPSTRAKNWRFYQGYLKKCGDISVSGVRHAQKSALLKSGIIGIKVSIMPPNITLPDHIEILDEAKQIIEEVKESKEEKTENKKVAKKKVAKKKTPTKKATKKKAVKKEEVKETKEPKVEAKAETKVEEKQEETTKAAEEKTEVQEETTEIKETEETKEQQENNKDTVEKTE